MFDNDTFRAAIDEQLRAAADDRGLTGYDQAIVGALQMLAVAHQEFLLTLEHAKPAYRRRDVADAVSSASTLARAAADAASARDSRRIELPDMARALAARYCSVWPFCRP